MFCPQCRMEYRPGVTQCSDCDVSLVNSLPDPAQIESGQPEFASNEPDYAELVTVYRTSNYTDLLIAKSLLESAGIEFWSKGDSLASMFFSGAIMVRPEDEAEVREMLTEMESPEDIGEDTGN